MTTEQCKKPCIYLDKMGICNYYLDTGRRRPCKTGPDCTVRIAGEKRRSNPQFTNHQIATQRGRRHKEWDVQKGLKMWLDGCPTSEMSKELGVSCSTIRKHAYFNWPARENNVRSTRKAGWDTERGRQMLEQGMTIAEISRALNVPYSTIVKYGKNHNWKKKGKRGSSTCVE